MMVRDRRVRGTAGRRAWFRRAVYEVLEVRYALHAGHAHDEVVEGIDAADEEGRSVYAAGDVNGDGIDDLVVGAARADHGAVSEDGETYVVFGANGGLGATIDPATLNGTNGFRLDGDLANDHFGLAVASAGDINGDGRSDLVVGAPDADPSGRSAAGSVYVIFGAATFASAIDVTTLNGTNGFRIDGVTAGDTLGTAVQGAGDINRDGKADFIIGAPGADFTGSGSGSAYVVFGAASYSATLSLASLTGANGFRIDGSAAADDLGRSISGAGDLNKDGFADVIVGAPGATVSAKTLTGSAFVVFGKASGFGATLPVSTLTGTNGFRVDGADTSDQFGQSVSSAGDFNADGFGDVVIGSPRAEVSGVSVGASYLVFGKASGFTATLTAASLTGASGFRISLDYESDPWLKSWIVNTTGATGFNGIKADVQTVVPDSADVYIHTDGVPNYSIGPWTGNPNTVTAQNANYEIPRAPAVKTGTKTSTALGATAVWVDGTAIFNASDGMSYNNQNVWHQNAYFFEKVSFDSCNGHPPPGGLYHTHIVPACLRTELGDNGTGHSPILGWSFDGYPIYGPYGYVNTDGTGGVTRLNTSWQTRNITTRTTYADGTVVTAGPTVATRAIGSYLEDYQYVAGSGQLDQYNGRFSVTPEFPNGIYHYVVTIDAAGIPAYPYIIGPSYNGVVETKNTTHTVGSPAATTISVAVAGDINGDGISDIAVGDPDSYTDAALVAGSAFILFGRTGTFTADFHLHNLNGTNGFHFHGLATADAAGTSVAPAGDFNHDGGADLLIGAPTATANGDATAGRTFVIYGTPSAVLTINVGTSTISENGGSTTATITRTSTTGDLTVTLGSNDTTEATVPATIVIPSGQPSAAFTISAQDDTILDGTQPVTITASATSYTSGTVNVNVTDFETLSLAINAAAMSERNGTATGTITRNSTDLSQPLTVSLTSNDTTEAAVPASVVIPANAAFVNFTVTAVDDALVDGTQTVTITATAAGYIGPVTKIIDVTDFETLAVDLVTVTATGVIVDFNRAFDSTTLNLYDVQDGSLGAADITLVGATTGSVRGSAIVDASSRRVTFVRTIGLLAADTYTLTLRSAANGFRDTNANVLDGNADGVAGGDYVQTITVNAAAPNAVTLSVPDFARGPEQAVNVPANVTTGIPVSFSDGGGITSASFQLRYDPTLLTIPTGTGAVVAPGLAGASMTIDTATTPGVAAIQFTSPTPLPAGTTHFIDLLASVPATAPYVSKQVLDFTNISLNGGAIPALDDDAVQAVAYFGDATANGSYSGQDATRVAGLAVGYASGLSPYKMLDPLIVADITLNDSFSGQDTTRVLQRAAALTVAEIPILPSPAVSLVTGGPDPKLSIPRDLDAVPGQSLEIPVNIDSIVDLTGNGVESADLAIYFDPTVFDVTGVSPGDLLGGSASHWMVATRIDPLLGRVFVSLAGFTPLEGTFAGELIKLHAQVRPDASAGAATINLAAAAPYLGISTQLNEGYLTLVPAPTDAANDEIDGLVTIRAAASNTPTARLVDGRLSIVGTSQNDFILVSPLGHDRVRARVNDRLVGDFAMPTAIEVEGLANDHATGDLSVRDLALLQISDSLATLAGADSSNSLRRASRLRR